MTGPTLTPQMVELRRAWLRSGESQESLAARLGWSRPRLCHVLVGRTQPSVGVFAELADALGYEVKLTPRKGAEEDVQ